MHELAVRIICKKNKSKLKSEHEPIFKQTFFFKIYSKTEHQLLLNLNFFISLKYLILYIFIIEYLILYLLYQVKQDIHQNNTEQSFSKITRKHSFVTKSYKS